MSRTDRKTHRFSDHLHPAAAIGYCLTLMIWAMTFTHPMYLGIVFILTVLGIISVNRTAVASWIRQMRFGLGMTVTIVILNCFVSRNGSTILWASPVIPLLGKLTLSREAILFGLNMGFKLCVILTVFHLYTMAMSTDKNFSFFSRFAYKSALTLILTALLVPQMRRAVTNVYEVMKVRGAKFQHKNFLERVHSWYPLLKVCLVSALEDSWQTAEALHSRGFASGPRTYYVREPWRRRDSFIMGNALIMLIILTGCLIKNKGFMDFYPTIQLSLDARDAMILMMFLLTALTLPVLNWVARPCASLNFAN
jgi:energy-coupling factor transport system permease protein